MKLQRISLDHIAKLAGVHKATVSRALRNHPTIPAHTRERIHEIARREGYRPNPLVAMYQAQARSNRPTAMQSALAWLNDYPNPTCWQEFPWLRGYLRGAKDRCEARGFRLDEIPIGGNANASGVEVGRISEILRQRGIFGVILPLMLHQQFLQEEWSDCVIALIGSGNQSASGPTLAAASRFYPQGFPIADRDFYFNLRLAFQTVIQRGYTRVGFIYSRYLDRESEGRSQAAFLVEQSLLPEAQRVPILFLERFKEGRPPAFDRWLETYKPDAILSINPVVREWVQDCGRSVPGDLGLVNLNVVDDVENWSGIRENHELIGAAAVDLLIGQLSRNEIGMTRQPRKVLIPGEWHEGGTLRPPSSFATERR
ncbi:MAG: LacI family DNA-binding transcriptional regulator [Terrimicrobiaceae bacterium]